MGLSNSINEIPNGSKLSFIEQNNIKLDKIIKNMKMDECYRITLQYKNKLYDKLPILGYDIKIIHIPHDEIGYEIICQSTYKNICWIQNFRHERMLLEYFMKINDNKNNIKSLHLYVKEAWFFNWYVEIKKININKCDNQQELYDDEISDEILFTTFPNMI